MLIGTHLASRKLDVSRRLVQDCRNSSAVAEHPMNTEVPCHRLDSLHARNCPQIYLLVFYDLAKQRT